MANPWDDPLDFLGDSLYNSAAPGTPTVPTSNPWGETLDLLGGGGSLYNSAKPLPALANSATSAGGALSTIKDWGGALKDWSVPAGIATNFIGGLTDDSDDISREQLAQQREIALRDEQLRREQLQQQWELGQQELAAKQLAQEEQSKQFGFDRAQQAAQFKAGTMGDVLGQRQQDALSRDKLGLEATQMDPLAQQKSRQKNAVMAALMGGAAPYSITPSADVFGPQGMPQLHGGLQIPEGGFDAETMAFFSPEARAGAEGQFANAVASVNPSLPTPDLATMGYGAAGTAPSQASDAFRSLQETELQSAQQEHLNSVLSALGSGGSSPTFTPMSSATAPQASDALAPPVSGMTPPIPGVNHPRPEDVPPSGEAVSRYAPRTAPGAADASLRGQDPWHGVQWGGNERPLKDDGGGALGGQQAGSGPGLGGIDAEGLKRLLKAIKGEDSDEEKAAREAAAAARRVG